MKKEIDKKTLLMHPIRSKNHLQAWLKEFLGFTLPDQMVTSFATASPLDFVYEVYRAIMDGTPLHIMALSGRDGSKTVSLSVIDILALLHDSRGAIHIGVTKAQAQRAREYLDNYIHKNKLINDSVVEENDTNIRLKIDDEIIGLEILPLSPKAVAGAHFSLVSYDEISTSTDDLHLKAYRDSAGIPGTSRKGKPAVIVKITSRQAGYSLAELEVKNAAKSGIKIVKWSTIDTMEKCPDSRSGTIPLPMYINVIKGLKYTEEEWKTLPESMKTSEFELTTDTLTTDTKKGCYTCPLALYCQGKAKNQTSDSVLLRSVDDVITKVNAAGSHDWVISQLLSLKPSSEGLVYFEFNRELHIPGWNKMWQVLTGSLASPSGVTREMFVNECKRRKCTFVGAVDWGWSSPSTFVLTAIDKKDNVFILEAFGRTFRNDPDWVSDVCSFLEGKYVIDMLLPDPENQSGLDLFRKSNIPVSQVDKGAGSVKNGINCIKGKLKVPGTNNTSKLFIAPDIGSTIPNVPGLVDEFELYKKEIGADGTIKDDTNPQKGNDHYLDALRYAMFWYFGKSMAQAVFATMEEKKPYNPNPTSTELADMMGVKYNDNRDQFEQMGEQPKKKKKSDDDDDDDPDGEGGGGSGLMVAWT